MQRCIAVSSKGESTSPNMNSLHETPRLNRENFVDILKFLAPAFITWEIAIY